MTTFSLLILALGCSDPSTVDDAQAVSVPSSASASLLTPNEGKPSQGGADGLAPEARAPGNGSSLCGPFAAGEGAALSLQGSALVGLLAHPGVRASCETTGPDLGARARLKMDYRGLERSPERELALWARQFGDCGPGEYVTQCRGTGCWDLEIQAAGSHGNGTVTILATPNGRCLNGGVTSGPSAAAQP